MLCTSQLGYGAATGRMKSIGIHTPGDLSGALKALSRRKMGFSGSGESTRRDIGFLLRNALMEYKNVEISDIENMESVILG